MGMAASQARYLALVARKSNCEYEGQQINQARTVLANQSANLFNQMLGLNVPIPPSTQDYTKTQYSFTDGVNASVIDSWKQLSGDPEYNYIVKSHYYTDRYTGSIKKMSDPQVQLSGNNPLATAIAPLAEIEAAQLKVETAKKAADEAQKAWEEAINATKAAKTSLTLLESQAYAKVAESIVSNVKGDKDNPTPEGAAQYKLYDVGSDIDPENVKYTFNKISDTTQYTADLTGMIKCLKAKDILADDFPEGSNIATVKTQLGITDASVTDYATLRTYLISKGTITSLDIPGGNNYKEIKTLLQNLDIIPSDFSGNIYAYGDIADPENFHIALEDDLRKISGITVDGTESNLVTFNYESLKTVGDKTDEDSMASQINAAKNTLAECQNIENIKKKAYYDETNESGAKVDYEKAQAAYDALVKPAYIGNSELTLLTELTKDQQTELKQVVDDMIAQGVDTDIINCFNADGTYKGGVYTFKLNGVVYYTTYNNLDAAYASNKLSNNDIDSQYKMPYYNASYISTKIEQEQKALLETDGNGRFSTVRFENDSVTYALNVEQITDDAAYQDAMNQYNYENAKYDKMVQDINAKTSIIQQQDRQLELRLKQLDTEQNALKTEMEAVQKIVKDNVEDTFKTFSG